MLDGCGKAIPCGTCASPQWCGGGGVKNKCGCIPETCARMGVNCGTVSDQCGGTLNCGTCSAPQTCGGGGTTNVCGCTPTTCAALGKNCGTVANGCGATMNCGSCASGQTCGGGGVANVCGTAPCVPKTCSSLGKNCGLVSDGCGATLDCGTCSGVDSCGGGGVLNVCGCTKKTCTSLGANCGTPSDGCGGTLASCGSCTAPATCGGGGVENHCGCTKKTACDTGDECGSIPDGCGGTVACGTCGSGLACNTSTRKCECVPTTCAAAGRTCGTISDGCGGTLTCTGCAGRCSGDVCLPYVVDNSAVCSSAGWCFRHRAPQPFRVNDMHAITTTEVYAVANYGTVMLYDGTRWTGVTGLQTQPFRGVWAASSSDVWVVGDSGAVFRGSDALGFTRVTVPTSAATATLYDVHGTAANDVWIAGSAGQLLHWDGSTLASVAGPSATATIKAVYASTATNVWTATTSGIYAWNGASWSLEDSSYTFESLWGTGSDIFAVGSTGIKRRVGSTWANMTTPSYYSYQKVTGTSSTNVFAVGWNASGGMLHRWDGTSWTSAATFGQAAFAATSLPGLEVLTGGDRGELWRRSALTTNVSTPIAGCTHLSKVDGASSNDIWVGGTSCNGAESNARLIHWNGSSWDFSRARQAWALWPAGSGVAFVSNGSAIYQESTTAAEVLELSGTFHGLWGTSASDVWAVGASANIKHKVGTTWGTSPSPLTGTTTALYSIWGAAANDVWVSGDLGYLMHWDGTAWTVVTSPTTSPITSLWGAASNDVWALTNTSVLHYDGTTWSTFQTIPGAAFKSIRGKGTDVWITAGTDSVYRKSGSTFVAESTGTAIGASGIYLEPSSSKAWVVGDNDVVIRKSL